MTDAASTTDREITISRVIKAPRERVFDAFTDPATIGSWWGPNRFSTTTATMDVRPGGIWRFVMHGPDGTDYANLITYREVTRPERLAYDHTDGADPPAISFEQVVTFEEVDGGTRVTLRVIFASAEIRRQHAEEVGAVEGGQQTLARLAAMLEESGA